MGNLSPRTGLIRVAMAILLMVSVLFACNQGKKQETVPILLRDVPIYRYGKVIEKKVAGNNARVVLSSTQDFETILNYYKKELAKRGWEKLGTNRGDDMITVTYKKEHLVLQIIIQQQLDSEMTRLTLVVSA